eukprot:gb/GECG01013919.1/.p1 GENE.gb/GECG01013919.1/~~gb/GECG01013919.1/.p1  ORF type:complete len:1672 (+),score=142.74 gb/GECG01013919.1/:1-5016(+)
MAWTSHSSSLMEAHNSDYDASHQSHLPHEHDWIALAAYAALVVIAFLGLFVHARWSIQSRRDHYGPSLSSRIHFGVEDGAHYTSDAAESGPTPAVAVGLTGGRCRRKCLSWFRYLPLRQRCFLCGNTPLGFHVALMAFAVTRFTSQVLIYLDKCQKDPRIGYLEVLSLSFNLMWLSLLVVYWTTIQLQRKNRCYLLSWFAFWCCNALIMVGLLVLCHYTIGHKPDGVGQFLAARESENIGEICVAVIATVFFCVTWGLWRKASEETKYDMKVILIINFVTCIIFLSRALIIIVDMSLRHKWYFVSIIYWVPDITTASCYTVLMWQRYLLHEEILAEGIGNYFDAMMVAWVKGNLFQYDRSMSNSLSCIVNEHLDGNPMDVPLLSGQSQTHPGHSARNPKLEGLVKQYWDGLDRRKNDMSLRVHFCLQMLTAVTSNSSGRHKHRLPVLERLHNKLDEVIRSGPEEGSSEATSEDESISVEMSQCHQSPYIESSDDSLRERLVKIPCYPTSSCCFLGLRATSLNVSGVAKSVAKSTEGTPPSEIVGPSIRARNTRSSGTDAMYDKELASHSIAHFSRSTELTNEEKGKIKKQFEAEWCTKELPCRAFFMVLNPSFLSWVVRVKDTYEGFSMSSQSILDVDESHAKHLVQVASFCHLHNLIRDEYHGNLDLGQLTVRPASVPYSRMLTNTGLYILNHDLPPELFVIAGETEKVREQPYIEVEQTQSVDAKSLRYKVTAAVDVSFHKCVSIPALPIVQLRKLASLAGVKSSVPLGHWCISLYEKRRSLHRYPTPPEQRPARSVSTKGEKRGSILSRLRSASSGAATRSNVATVARENPPVWENATEKLNSFTLLFDWIASVPTFSIDFEEALNSIFLSCMHRSNAEFKARFFHGCFTIPITDDILTIERCTGNCDVTNGYISGLRKEPRDGSYSFGTMEFGRYMVTAFTSPISFHLGPRTMTMGYSFDASVFSGSGGLYNLVEYVTESNAAAVVPRNILPWILARRMESALNLANAGADFVSRTLNEAEKQMSSRTHELSMFGRVISYLQYYEEIYQDIKCLGELQGLFIDRAHWLHQYWSNSFLQSRDRAESQNVFSWQDLHRLRREEATVEEAVASRSALTFKPSTVKAKFNFRYMATNLHVHRVLAFRADAGMHPPSVSSAIVTVGAPAIQYDELPGYSLLRRIRSYKQAQKDLRDHQDYKLPRLRTRKRRQLEKEHQNTLFHADSVVSQALSGALSAVVASLDSVLDSLSRAFRSGVRDESACQKIAQWFDCGFPLFWESLLSSFREERDMLEDMDVGLQSLAFFGFELLLSDETRYEADDDAGVYRPKAAVSWEGIEFHRCKVQEDYPLGVFRIPIRDPLGVFKEDGILREYVQERKDTDIPDKVATLIPVLFGYGLNEWQPLGEIVNPELYHSINGRSLEIVRHYSKVVQCRWHSPDEFWNMRNKLYTLLRANCADAFEVLDWLVDPDLPTIKTPGPPFSELPSQHEPNIDRVLRLANRVEEITREHRERVRRNRSKVNVEEAAKLNETGATPDTLLMDTDSRFAELLLEIFECVARELDGGRLTSCKSAKDRTGMAVTLEHARNVLGALFGDDIPEYLQKNAQVELANHLREYGSRIHIAYKNTRMKSASETCEGQTQFAINSVQNRWFPSSYQCPRSVLHSSGKAIT